MTQEKIIQAFGRVGRNKINAEYTIRLRDNTLVSKNNSIMKKIN